uniref:Uncharacterized protein n=1 Tax=Anguilla anguilla TaxID=7936 RepID=A0A0E9WKZ4_ANGAN
MTLMLRMTIFLWQTEQTDAFATLNCSDFGPDCLFHLSLDDVTGLW